MEQHEVDTFVAMAKRQYGDNPEVWAREAMKYAYNLGYEHGYAHYRPDPWEHEDDIPF